MKHHVTAAGLALGLVAGSAAGLVLVPVSAVGQTTPAAPPVADETIVLRAPGEHLRSTLAPLVSDGTLTQAQADKVIAALEAARPKAAPGGHRFHVALDVVAATLGITESALHEALRAGQSIAEVAGRRNVTPQRVVEALVAEARTRLDEKVTAGALTRAEAATRLADMRGLITALVNGEGPRPGRLRGAWVPAPADTTTGGNGASTA